MNQLKEIGGLSKMLSSSLEASKNSQEEYQNKVLDLLESILSDLDFVHDQLLVLDEIKIHVRMLNDYCPGHFLVDNIHCQICEFKNKCQHEN